MSWWAIVYLVLFGVLAAAGLWDDFRDRRPAWFLGCAAVSNLTIIFLFVAFWQPSLRSSAGLGSTSDIHRRDGLGVVSGGRGHPRTGADPELSERQQRVVATIAAIASYRSFACQRLLSQASAPFSA